MICSEEDISEEVDRKIMTHKMRLYMESHLSQREKQILILRYGLDGVPPQTQKEIAETLRISRSYVSRLEKSALEKLREVLEGKSENPA